MLKNIVFDMGMVLLAWNPKQSCLRHCDTPERAERLHNLLFQSPEWAGCIDTGKMHIDEYLNLMLTRSLEEDKPYIRKILSDYWIDALYPIAGMEELVKELLEKGYRLYLLSNVGYQYHDFSYKIIDIKRFSGVLLSCEQKMVKPDPAIYQRLCDLYGLKPEECLFVDDVEKNVQGARSIGMHALCFDGTPACVEKEIQKLQN